MSGRVAPPPSQNNYGLSLKRERPEGGEEDPPPKIAKTTYEFLDLTINQGIFHEVMTHLPVQDVCQLKLVCENIKTALEPKSGIWRKLYIRDFQAQFPISTDCADFFSEYQKCHLIYLNIQKGRYTTRSFLDRDFIPHACLHFCAIEGLQIVNGQLISSTTIKNAMKIDVGSPPLSSYITLWDTEKYKPIESILFPEGFLEGSGTVIIDNKKIFVGNQLDNRIHCYDLTSRQWSVLEGHATPIKFIGSDGKNLISISKENTLKIWDLTKNKCVKTFGKLVKNYTNFPDTNGGRFFIARETLFIANGAYIKMLDVKTMKWMRPFVICPSAGGKRERIVQIQGADGLLISLSSQGDLAPNGDIILIIRIWDLQTNECLHAIQEPKGAFKGCAAGNGMLFVRKYEEHLVKKSGYYVIDVWNCKSGKKIASFESDDHPMPMNLATHGMLYHGNSFFVFKDGKLFLNDLDKTRVLDFTASHEEILEQIRSVFAEQPRYKPLFQEEYKTTASATRRFSAMPEEAKEEVYNELARICNWPPDRERARQAFLQNTNAASPWQKARAIQNKAVLEDFLL